MSQTDSCLHHAAAQRCSELQLPCCLKTLLIQLNCSSIVM
uniref:Uncharacterized protein n=1 Tax=Anguilla anguilla TaxID=7936 RepID=A0A0E9S9B9_ANGAN